MDIKTGLARITLQPPVSVLNIMYKKKGSIGHLGGSFECMFIQCN